MEAESDNMEIRVEDVAEATEILERGMKEAAKEAKIKAALAKAANLVSSAANAASTTAPVFTRAPTYTTSSVGVPRRRGYTLLIIRL